MRLKSENSLLLIVDLQAGLLPVIDGGNQAVSEAQWLGGLACELDVPVWLTEQYPEGLGGSEPRLLEALPDYRLWQKVHFNAHAEPDFAAALEKSGRRQIVLCGSEAHICVMQTGLGLLEAGYEVYWLSEASVSRRAEEACLARERMTQAGATPVTADMVAYEWLERCDDERFRLIHRRFLKPRASRPLRFY
ncbi:isochorismatase family protein [Halomonas daqingensis]|uniref:Isochorismatase family protein n=1 Tax=Billgrantia desiderata TaxID=52021 RepID=A0AAW4Z3D9_9GAMM|nr:isochorismatase family protein [Halomonas desiderata]MCE8042836.1 isochorismatase family protein [Halomonas desiderata]MCE8047411.1 isochorismatase family protein [Halomonas desiderata]MCE8053896.1 isochorismatase family protein [Halomonas desiderata]SEG43392.1 Isochorismatase family protein [Halomonas desiderata]